MSKINNYINNIKNEIETTANSDKNIMEIFKILINKFSFLSNNTIKIIATMTMIIDNFAIIILENFVEKVLLQQAETGLIPYEIYKEAYIFTVFDMQRIGRMTFPIFAFLLVQGFLHTQNKKKYFILMLIFGIISELPFDLAYHSDYSHLLGTYPLNWRFQNVFFTYALAILFLSCLEKIKEKYLINNSKILYYISNVFCIWIFCNLSEILRFQYGNTAILYVLAFYIFRNNKIIQSIIYIPVHFITTFEVSSEYFIITSLLILFYNGERGKFDFKYLFYIFYPLHITIFYLITTTF